MVDFSLTEEQREIRNWVRTFVERELMPLEPEVLRRERNGEGHRLTPQELHDLRQLAKKSDFWGIQTPVEYGGMGLDAVTTALVEIELGRTFIPFSFGGGADNILFYANEEQKKRYLLPTIAGERKSCFAITEPGAGSDAKAIRTRAVQGRRPLGDQRGEDVHHRWERSRLRHGVRRHRPGEGRQRRGDLLPGGPRGGMAVPAHPHHGRVGAGSLVFDNVRVPEPDVLGEVGKGFELAMKWIGRAATCSRPAPRAPANGC